MSILSELVIFF